MIYSILVGKHIIDSKLATNKKKRNYFFNYVISSNLKFQACEMVKELNLDDSKLISITNIKRIEHYLKYYRIVCYDWSNNKNIPIYINKSASFKYFIYIIRR